MVAFSSRIRDYVYTVVGLGSPLLFQPALSFTLFVGVFLEVVGSALVLGAFLSLNKSFGLGPENRGIKTGGAYRLVRHPMYAGYMLAELGFFLDNFSFYNLFILAVSILFLLLRLRAEERFLQKDPSYKKYALSVRWRLVPLIF
jgi:protein-S-isoprenylcysteine O-methyltransferase Ste14